MFWVSSCPSSAGINERAVPGRTFGVNLCFLLATNGAAESKRQHPYRQINLVIDPGASLLFTAGTERASQISQQRLVYTQYRKTYQRWPTGLKNTFTETSTIAPNNAGAAALHALLWIKVNDDNISLLFCRLVLRFLMKPSTLSRLRNCAGSVVAWHRVREKVMLSLLFKRGHSRCQERGVLGASLLFKDLWQTAHGENLHLKIE